jgi:outer membrane immunogenic protein
MKSLRCYLLATASSAALIGNAAAADMTMPTKAAPVPVAWSWAGPYIGLNLGAAWDHAKFSDLGAGPSGFYAFSPPNNDPFWSPKKAGFTFGGQAGYNWQTGNIVYGLEADLNWANAKANENLVPFGVVTVTANTKMDWMTTVRGRLGVAFSQYLLYATGGVAFAHFSDSWGFTVTGGNSFTSNTTRTGWTAGGGLEYMLARNWSLGVEVLYADFGSKDVSVFLNGIATPYTSRFKHNVTTARAALNWKW